MAISAKSKCPQYPSKCSQAVNKTHRNQLSHRSVGSLNVTQYCLQIHQIKVPHQTLEHKAATAATKAKTIKQRLLPLLTWLPRVILQIGIHEALSRYKLHHLQNSYRRLLIKTLPIMSSKDRVCHRRLRFRWLRFCRRNHRKKARAF